VPQLSLDQLAFKLGPTLLIEGLALSSARYVMPACERPRGRLPSSARTQARLASRLRQSLCAQTAPLVDALCAWSNLRPAALWGLFASAWVRECVNLGLALGCSASARRTFEEVVRDDPRFELAPRLYWLEHAGQKHLCQVRGSCCLYHRVPGAVRCASCPALPQDERERRQRATLDTTS
jgi:hypothetical protein